MVIWYCCHGQQQACDPQLEGNWSVKAVKSPNVEITDGQRTRVVYVNHIRHRVPPKTNTAPSDTVHNTAAIHLRLTMFCFSHPASHLSLHSPLGIIGRERDGHPIASHKLEVKLYSEGACVEL